jgi:hypothetical protein
MSSSLITPLVSPDKVIALLKKGMNSSLSPDAKEILRMLGDDQRKPRRHRRHRTKRTRTNVSRARIQKGCWKTTSRSKHRPAQLKRHRSKPTKAHTKLLSMFKPRNMSWTSKNCSANSKVRRFGRLFKPGSSPQSTVIAGTTRCTLRALPASCVPAKPVTTTSKPAMETACVRTARTIASSASVTMVEISTFVLRISNDCVSVTPDQPFYWHHATGVKQKSVYEYDTQAKRKEVKFPQSARA